MKTALVLVCALLVPAVGQAQTTDEQIEAEFIAVTDALADELLAVVPQYDQSYECNAVVAAVAQGVSIRSGGTNWAADVIGAYCAGAELFSWLREWQLRAVYDIGQIRLAMNMNWLWKHGGFWWQYWV